MTCHHSTALRHGLLASVTATMLGSCSLVLEFDECRTNEDCENAAGEALVCNLDRAVCEPLPDPSNVLCEASSACAEVFGEASICGPQGRCAMLTSDECSKVVWPQGAPPRDAGDIDDIVWIGSVLATSEPFTATLQPIENAIELAVEDFNSVTALPDGRQVGWIACDSQGDPNLAADAAQHLIDDVGVPAIIGPALSEEVLELRPTIVDSGTFLITPTASAASIASLDDNGLIWRTISSDAVQANAIADRLASMDPAPTSILVLAKNDAYGLGLFEPMLQRLASALPGVPTGSLVYPNPIGLTDAQIQREYATVIAEGFAQQADTIVLLGAAEVFEVIRAYLLAWNNSGMPLPRFVVSHGAVPTLQVVPGLVAESFAPTLMNSMEGISPNIQDPVNFEAFNIRYRVVFSDLNPLSASPVGYDAAMVTLLGLVAADGRRGVDIANAMPRLANPAGTSVPLGDVQSVLDARELLVSGASIDIGGVSGPLDFNLVTGEISSNYVGWDVVPLNEGSPMGKVVPARAYVLDSPLEGTWTDL